MELGSSDVPRFEELEPTIQDSHCFLQLGSSHQDTCAPEDLKVTENLTANTSQSVSAEVIAGLYYQFRKAVLESTARGLQQREKLLVFNSISTNLLQPSLKLRSDTYNPNDFDPYLNTIPQIEFLGFRFHRMSQVKALEVLLSLTESDRTYRVYFVNAHSIEVAFQNPGFSIALKRGNLLLADGSGVLLGSQLTGKPLLYNLNGTDLIPALFNMANRAPKKVSVYFLGAKPGIAHQAATNVLAQYSRLQVVGIQDGYFAESDVPAVLSRIRETKPDLLLVAMGTPLQEIWIDRYSSQLPGTVCIGVGGLFDFMAGSVPRAPRLMRHLGSEWIWRLLMEPRRLWQRYTIGNLVYLWVLLTFTMQHLFLQLLRSKTTQA